jgi:hypothetical protein
MQHNLSMSKKIAYWLGRCKRNENGCLIWPGAKAGQGHAQVFQGGKTVTLSRIILEHKLGRPLGPGMCACHECDVRDCLNQDHLFEGTFGDNNRDTHAKGRNIGWRFRCRSNQAVLNG